MNGAASRRLELTGVGHRFPGTAELFRGVTATCVPGEVVGLVGPSGSGKSTLLSILAGWTAPAEGTVTRHGIEHAAWVFQNPHGVPRRSALDHVVLPLIGSGMLRRDAERQALGILDSFNLAHLGNRPFRALSGGEAQRLMLARAVATGAGLLLVDEPTAQLDLATAAAVNGVVARTAANGAIVVIATHDAHTRDACDRVLDLAEFQVEATGAATS